VNEFGYTQQELSDAHTARVLWKGLPLELKRKTLEGLKDELEYYEYVAGEKTIMFNTLDKEQEDSFRQWAHDNFEEGKNPDPCWHPVVRDEWRKVAEFKQRPVTK
jgi:hypothetical protein